MMYVNDLGDPLIFPVTPLAGQCLHSLCKISQHLPDGLTDLFEQIFNVLLFFFLNIFALSEKTS